MTSSPQNVTVSVAVFKTLKKPSKILRTILAKSAKEEETKTMMRRKMKMTCKQKSMLFTEVLQENGKTSKCLYTEVPSQKSIRKTKKYSKVSKNWEKRSSWNYSFPKEGNAPVPQSATQTPLLRQDPSPTPCRSDYWENIPYVTFTPITRRIMETPFLSVMQRDWRWNTYCTEKRATMRTSQHRSPLF